MSLNLDRSAWTRVKFGDVVKQGKDKTDPEVDGIERYVAGEHMDSNNLSITRWGLVGDGYLGPAFHRKFTNGQVLYGSRRTYLRKVALADFDGVCANTTFVMQSSDPELLLPDLLPFIMSTESFHASSIAESKGSVNPYVNWPDIAKYEFNLPPLDQQRRIADLLWSLESHLSAIGFESKSLLDLLSAHRDSLVWGAGHQERRLAEVLESCEYGTSERCVSERSEGHTIVLRIPNVVSGHLTLGDLKFLPKPVPDSDPASLQDGDLLVVRTNGNPNYVGSGALVPRHDGVWLCASYLLRVRANRDLLLPEFLNAGWKAPTMRERLVPYIRSSAGNYNLSASSLLAQKFPVPPLDEQRSACRALAQVRDALQRVASEAEELGQLKDALISFLGRSV